MAQSADINGLLCPITCEVMRDPVILTGDGQTYERVAIEQWLRKGGQSSPATGASLGGNCMLIANRALRNTIDEMCSNGLLKDADIFVNQADGVYGGGGGGGGAQMKFGGGAAMPAVANLGAAGAAAHPKGSPPTQTTFEAPPKTDGGSSATLPNSARPAAAAAAASGVAWNRTRVPVRDPSDPPGCSRRWQRRSQPPPPRSAPNNLQGPDGASAKFESTLQGASAKFESKTTKLSIPMTSFSSSSTSFGSASATLRNSAKSAPVLPGAGREPEVEPEPKDMFHGTRGPLPVLPFLLHPPLTFSRRLNADGEGVPADSHVPGRDWV